jgi:hypothetical protein
MTLDQISVCSIDTFNISNTVYFVLLNMKTTKTRGYNFLNFPSKVSYALTNRIISCATFFSFIAMSKAITGGPTLAPVKSFLW